MVIKEALQKVISDFKLHNVDNAIFEAHLIFKTVTALSELDLVLRGSENLKPADEAEILRLAARRKKGEPLQYILGTEEFMGLEFMVNPAVLIPRQDTEVLVETVLKAFDGKAFTALDLCTGSGCIAISLACHNKNARITAFDISQPAVNLARMNAERHGVQERVIFEVGDVFEKEWFGKYDLVVSNPPYIESDVIPTLAESVYYYEPKTALDGGADGLDFYRRIIKTAPKCLKKGGILAFEIGYNQGEAVEKLMQRSFKAVKVIKDYGGNDRVVTGIRRDLKQFG